MFDTVLLGKEKEEVGFIAYNGTYFPWDRAENPFTKATETKKQYEKFKKDHPEIFGITVEKEKKVRRIKSLDELL